MKKYIKVLSIYDSKFLLIKNELKLGRDNIFAKLFLCYLYQRTYDIFAKAASMSY